MSRKLRENEIETIFSKLIELLILSIIGGFVGFSFCKYNQYNIAFGIVLGIACPWGYVWVNYVSKRFYDFFEDLYILISIVTFGLYAILWFLVKIFISAFVGIIAMPILIVYYIYNIILALKKKNNTKYNDINLSNKNSSINMKKIKLKKDDEKYYCERCFKEISYEECELYDNMCEECFMDSHIDDDGNYIDRLL